MVSSPSLKSPGWVSRLIPFAASVRGYRRAWFRHDVLGAFTVTALLIPEGMAYAQIAGLPPQAVFYAAPAGLVLYALFGSSRQLVVSASAAVAVVSAATVGTLTQTGSARFVALTAALALLAGLISVLAGVLRLGRVAQFFSASVLSGFVFGLALIIAIKQVPKLFGIEGVKGDFFERLWLLITHLPQTHPLTLLVGAVSIALLVGLERLSRRVPAALVVLVLGVVASAILGLQARGVAVVGHIPAGLAPPHVPDAEWKDLFILVPGAAGLALVAFAEAIGPARMFAARHSYEVDANRELVGLGATNMGAGLFQGFAMGCSLSKSAANDEVGARTQVSSILSAGLTVVVALFLAPLFSTLPEATLAAIVLVAVSGMMEVPELARLRRLNRPDFFMALTALLGVLIFDVLPGLIIAVGLSLLLTVYRTSLPRLSEVGRVPGTTDLVAVHREPSAITVPGLLVLRPEENLFFANVEGLHDEVLRQLREARGPVKEVLLDLELTESLDVPSADMLRSLHDDLAHRGIVLSLARVHASTRRMMQRAGVLEKVGIDHVYPQVSTGVEAWLAHHESRAQQEWQLIRDGLHQLQASVDVAGSTLHGEERRRMEELRRRLDDADSGLGELMRH